MQDNLEDGSPYDPEMDCWDCGELPGTCAIKVNEENIDEIVAYVKNTYSYARNIYLIGGESIEYEIRPG